MKRLEYRVVYNDGPGSLTALVQALIDEGWVPQGGVAPRSEGGYFQALVRPPEALSNSGGPELPTVNDANPQ